MENVPKLEEFGGGLLLDSFEKRLETAGYAVTRHIVRVSDYGLPQMRRRLVVMASKMGPIALEAPVAEARQRTVADEIKNLPPLVAGQIHPNDPLHRVSKLSNLNLRRIRASKPGGTWHDWDAELIADCHAVSSGKTYSAVYGRMDWNKPSPTITTQFFGFGSGRFGHPEQDRAISLREGAMLQSFPREYEFVEPGKKVHIKTVGRLIGNAVPVTLGRVIARSVRRHLAENVA
jgi:DNA (cytosine-5)-methyltransferase 1